MPLPENERTVELSKEVITSFQNIFGKHPGYRPAHAKGLLTKGTFTPTAEAATLTTAPHFNQPSTPILVRLSSSTGIPNIPDTDPNGDPRGFALRFQLATTPRRVHTDIVAHSTDSFPMGTPEGALAFFQSIPNGTVGDFIQKNPTALRFVTIPKPTPNGFEHEQFWGVNAFKFIDAQGKGTFIRYRIAPDEGVETLDEEQLKGKSPAFLYEGVKERLTSGKPFSYKLLAQIAEEGDKTDDATVLWPDTRKIVTLGTIKIESVADHNAEEQKYLIWDPIPRVQGIEPSDDPLLDLRAGVYIIGGKDRRAAAVTTEAAV